MLEIWRPSPAGDVSDIALVFEHYGWDCPTGLGWKKCRCPFHGPDRNPSAQVNHELDRFNCFVCDFRAGPVKLIMEQEGVGGREANAILTELGGGDDDVRGVADRGGGGVSAGPRRYAGDGRQMPLRLRRYTGAGT